MSSFGNEICESDSLAENGFFRISEFVDRATLQDLRHECEKLSDQPSVAGIRFPTLKRPAIRSCLDRIGLPNRVSVASVPACKLVRSILFDKSKNANWDVSWHQDTTIALAARREVTGFGPWSVKEGIAHVRAPVEVLQGMITVRIHLDAADNENGALLVIPGSHRHGILGDEVITKIADAGPVETCAMNAGDALVMRPLLLHASKKSIQPYRRRVLHLEYAVENALPTGLSWLQEV